MEEIIDMVKISYTFELLCKEISKIDNIEEKKILNDNLNNLFSLITSIDTSRTN